MLWNSWSSSFEDNIGNKGDLPLVAYMDFETTAMADNSLTRSKIKCLLFHTSLGHSSIKSTTVDCLTEDQLKFVDKDLLNQLKDCAINVSERRCKNAVALMFVAELKFASNCLLKWFNRKFKIQNMEIDHKEKITCEAFYPKEWKKTKCFICKFS